MNISYQKNSQVNSNNDIYATYLPKVAMPAGALRRMLDRILAFLSHMLLSLTSARAKSILRVSGVALSLIGMLCVVSAIESGALSLFGGLLLGGLFIGIEFLCLRRH